MWRIPRANRENGSSVGLGAGNILRPCPISSFSFECATFSTAFSFIYHSLFSA